jgi:RTX calcium-binding nonapeptide repeat (4 copies)
VDSLGGLAIAWKLPSRRAQTAIGIAVAGLLLLSLTPGVEARTRCAYSGAPGNTLTVRSDGALAEITRLGQRIVVREFLEPSRRCSGGDPTVLNTDTIEVLLNPGGFAELLLRGGPFAPGATAETEGASEIEVGFVGSDVFVAVSGTTLADEFQWGPGPDRHPGLNLNPGVAGDQDVDVTVEGSLAFLNAFGRGGNDSIVPTPGAVFPNDGVFSTGGPGGDRLVAPRNSSGLLQGGPGDDVLIGGMLGDVFEAGGGNDRIEGGPGRDLIRGGPGRDNINSRDAWRDTVRCGPGRDQVNADQHDRMRECEVVSRIGLAAAGLRE